MYVPSFEPSERHPSNTRTYPMSSGRTTNEHPTPAQCNSNDNSLRESNQMTSKKVTSALLRGDSDGLNRYYTNQL
jgi:hypothetical protein